MLLKEGDSAVEFCLPDNGWERTCLNEFNNRKVVLYFFPEGSSSDNIKEACKFRDAYDEIVKQRAIVVGVGADKPRINERIIEKYKLPFLLLSDTNHQIAEAYGAWEEKQFFCKSYKRVIRLTYIIDEKGKIQKVFKNVDLEDHIDEVLYTLRN
jgi:thioredoxin-dependent peroxiredoxin